MDDNKQQVMMAAALAMGISSGSELTGCKGDKIMKSNPKGLSSPNLKRRKHKRNKKRGY